MKKPLVSIIITSCMDAAYIGQTLNCVFNQTFSKDDTEILIAHDYSTDASGDIVQQWIKDNQQHYCHTIRFTEHYKEHNGTRSATRCPAHLRNDMIRCSQGRFIAPQDGDDLWDSDKLALQVNVLSGDAALCAVGYKWIAADNQELGVTVAAPTSGFYNQEDILGRPTLINSAFAWDQEKTGQIFYDEREKCVGFEDQKFWSDCLSQGRQAYCIADILMLYRVLQGSTSSKLPLSRRPIGTEDIYREIATSYKGDWKPLFADACDFLDNRCANWLELERTAANARPALIS